MKRPHQLVVLSLFVWCLRSVSAHGQSIPAGVGSAPNIGFQLPRLGGSYSYALNASELISTGFYGTGTSLLTNVGGDLSYTSTSQSHPFSAVYSGGVLISNGTAGEPTTTYQDLSVAQVLHTRNWNFEVQDGISYTPETPAAGLSGIPGAGDLGIDPVPVGPASGIGILTDYGPRVSNTATASAARMITPHVSTQASGYYTIQRFIGDNSQDGLDNNGYGGSAGVSYHFNSLSAVTVSYNYSLFSYSPYSYTSQGATIDYSRQWSRRLSTDFYVGPQYLSSNLPVTPSGTVAPGAYGANPSSTQIAGGASVAYSTRSVFYTLGYNRGANNGSGVLPGSFSDNVMGAVHRVFGRAWNTSGFASYSRSSSLPNLDTYTFVSDAVSVGGQVSRALGRRFSGFASYTIEDQSFSGSGPALNAFSGFYQTFAIGVSYSPGSVRLGK